MRLILFADIHLGQISDSFIEKNGLERSINETIKQLYNILEYSIKNKINKIIVAGDIFEYNNPISRYNEIFNAWLKQCDDENIEVILISGNHDENNSSVSALAPIKKANFKNVVVIDGDVKNIIIYNRNFIFVPHLTKAQLKIKDVNDYEKRAKEIIKEKINERVVSEKNNIIVGHLHAMGAVIGNEQRKLKGGINFFPEVDGKKILKIFLGHIHRSQNFKMKGIDTWYCGSITRNDFSEVEEEKGFLVYDSIKDEVEFIKLDTAEYKIININLVDKNLINLDEEKIKKVARNKVLKIVINSSEDNRKLINISEIENAFNKYGYVAKVDINIEKKDKKEIDAVSFDPFEFTKKYINKNVEDKKQRQFILEESLSILKEVL